MVDPGEEVLEAVELTPITRDDLNEAMASLKTSMMTEVKSMFKELLEGMKSTPDPLLVVNPTALESEANFGKETTKDTHVPSPHDKNGTGTFAAVPSPRSMEDRCLHLALNIIVLLPSLLRVNLLIGSFALSLI